VIGEITNMLKKGDNSQSARFGEKGRGGIKDENSEKASISWLGCITPSGRDPN